MVLNDKGGKRRSRHGRDHVNGGINGKGPPALVQKEDLGYYAGGEHLRRGTKESRDGAGRAKGVEGAGPRAHRRPDGRGHDGDLAPEAARHDAKHPHGRHEQDGPDDDASQYGGDLPSKSVISPFLFCTGPQTAHRI